MLNIFDDVFEAAILIYLIDSGIDSFIDLLIDFARSSDLPKSLYCFVCWLFFGFLGVNLVLTWCSY